MMLFRPAMPDDVVAIAQLAQEAGTGLTTLPKDPQKIAEKIELSTASFAKAIDRPGPEYYFFVLENIATGELAGTSALAAAVGMEQPFYTYKLGQTVQSSRALGIHKTIQTLILGCDYTGATEICTLFLSPNQRGSGTGKLLSKARFLFIAQHPDRFADMVIAEMRGYSNQRGESPFWESLGRKFFDLDFDEADVRSGEETNEFIAELMPKYPIYVNMLSEQAQQMIGIVHPHTEPAVKLLEKEGFKYNGYVDIFDAGPTLEVDTDHIDTIKRSFSCTCQIIDQVTSEQQFLIANSSVQNYRSVLVPAEYDNGNLSITPAVAKALQVNENDTLIAAMI